MNFNYLHKINLQRSIVIVVFCMSIISVIISCKNTAQLQQDIYYTNGRDLYIKHCQNCHGKNGEGFGALTPPLTDTLYLKTNKRKLACFIKKGVTGPVSVHQKTYNDKMPGFPELADIDIAQLIVFITNTHGSKQGMYTTDKVAADLKGCQ